MTAPSVVIVPGLQFERLVDDVTGQVLYRMIIAGRQRRGIFPSKRVGDPFVRVAVHEKSIDASYLEDALAMVEALDLIDEHVTGWERCYCEDKERHYHVRYLGTWGHSLDVGYSEEGLRSVAQKSYDKGMIRTLPELARMIRELPSLKLPVTEAESRAERHKHNQ